MRYKNLVKKASIITTLVALILCLYACSKNDKPNSESVSFSTQSEDETKMIFSTRSPVTKEESIQKIYKNFLVSEDIKNKYPNIYAVQMKDISLCEPEFLKYLSEESIEDFSAAVVNTEYLDLDNDGTKEMLLSTDVRHDGWYIDLYIFDIDKNSNVFLGASFLRLFPSRLYDHISIMKDNNQYYIMRYTNDGQYFKTCEKLIYNGKEALLDFSLYAQNPSRLTSESYPEPLFLKSNSNQKSLYGYYWENQDAFLDAGKCEYLSYEIFEIEWNSCFNKTRVCGYCD